MMQQFEFLQFVELAGAWRHSLGRVERNAKAAWGSLRDLWDSWGQRSAQHSEEGLLMQSKHVKTEVEISLFGLMMDFWLETPGGQAKKCGCLIRYSSRPVMQASARTSVPNKETDLINCSVYITTNSSGTEPSAWRTWPSERRANEQNIEKAFWIIQRESRKKANGLLAEPWRTCALWCFVVRM